MTFRLAILAALLCLSAACTFQRPTWHATMAASPGAVEAALADDVNYPFFWDVDRSLIPDVEPPIHLRPCCAFGSGMQTRVGVVPVPFYRHRNVTHPTVLGPHTYDAGLAGRGTDREVEASEKNGQVYTCRGGFIDTAHIRDYADWTVFLFAWIERNFEQEASLELPPELGPRVLRLHAFDASQLGPVEQLVLTTTLAQYLSYQLSAWHEVAQWHGFTIVPLFPEYPSAYSVEDLYSNALGTKIAGALIYSGVLLTDQAYARNMDVWLRNTLHELGAVPTENGKAYMAAVDQYWWDSNNRIPDKWAVLKRNYDIGATDHEPPRLPPELRAKVEDAELLTCDEDTPPVTLQVVDELYGLKMAELATLEITISDEFAEDFPFPTPESRATRAVTQADFAHIGKADAAVDREELRARGWLARWSEE